MAEDSYIATQTVHLRYLQPSSCEGIDWATRCYPEQLIETDESIFAVGPSSTEAVKSLNILINGGCLDIGASICKPLGQPKVERNPFDRAALAIGNATENDLGWIKRCNHL